MKWVKVSYLPALFLCLFLWTCGIHPLLAQTTGKIAGKITDVSGAPMPGTNVVVEGSNRGASANAKGEYFILNLPPGNYTLVFSMIGYETVRVNQVRVQVDRTTTQDMVMKEASLEMDEIVVSAEASLITKDQTSASAKISGDELKILPADGFL